MSTPAIFIIDMLNDCFCQEKLTEERAELCKRINQLTAFGRKNNYPIIWVRQEFRADLSDAFLEMRKENIQMYIEGTPGAQILPELHRESTDYEIVKKRFSMFYNTPLDQLLENLKPSKLILAGVNTHACIRTAAIDAYQRDYEIIIIEDCVSSNDQEHHEVTLRYLGRRIAKVVELATILNRAQLL